MADLSTLPFKPIKGQAFTVYFAFISSDGTRPSISSFTNALISKDGAAYASLSNAPVEIDSSTTGKRATFSLVLTSSEMSANVIFLNFTPNSGEQISVIIYTTLSELSAAPTLNSSIADKITALYQYFFFKRTVTATVETMYKNDGSTSLATNTLSDNGTTVSKGALA